MKYVAALFSLIVYFFSFSLFSQTGIQTSAEADSLRRTIVTARHDTVRINAMNELSRYFWRIASRFDSSLSYAKEAEKISERIGFRKGVASALNNIGIIYSQQGKYIQALEHYLKALPIYEELGMKENIANSLNNIGNANMSQGNYKESLAYHFKALRMYEELGTKVRIASSITNIAIVYRRENRYKDALEYHLKALQIYEELNNKVGIALSLSNIGLVYEYENKNSEALEYHFKALNIREKLSNKMDISISLNNIGKVYYQQGKYSESLEYQFKALRIKEEIEDKPGVSITLNGIGQAYRLQGKFDSALVYSFRALRLAESIGARGQKKEALEALSICYDSLGQHKRALEYHRQFVALKDSLVNAESLEKTAKLREGYEAEKREQQITLLSKDQALKESELTRQQVELARAAAEQQAQTQSILLLNNEKDLRELTVSRQEAELTAAHARDEQNNQALALAQSERELQRAEIQRRNVIQWSLAAFLLLVATSTLWLLRLNRQKQRAYSKVQKQQEVLEEQAIEIEAANKELLFTNAELDEANRMKTQLLSMAAHDLKNPLGVIIGYSDLILFDTPKESETGLYVQDIQSTAHRMNKLIGELLTSAAMEMGNITLELDDVEVLSLISMIASRYEDHAAEKLQRIEVEADADISILADGNRLEQVFDNLVSNAVKYSPHGKTIWLRVKQMDTIVRCEVQDEGPGMSEEDRQKLFGFFQRLSAQPTGGESSSGVGLAIVKKIVDLHKGKIWAESQLGNGTTFIVELPISR
jgi:signal transduction histidine kinase/tetratricopeptide (TPR) repeat protein